MRNAETSMKLRLAVLALAAMPLWGQAADVKFTLVIENHRFQPAELVVPAHQKIKLIVENRDTTAEEFESYALNREKVIAGKSSASIWIGPLKPGKYGFFGDFNPKTAQGTLIAK